MRKKRRYNTRTAGFTRQEQKRITAPWREDEAQKCIESFRIQPREISRIRQFLKDRRYVADVLLTLRQELEDRFDGNRSTFYLELNRRGELAVSIRTSQPNGIAMHGLDQIEEFWSREVQGLESVKFFCQTE